MSRFHRALVVIASLILVALVFGRLFAPDIMAKNPLGFLLNLVWASLLVYALADWRGITQDFTAIRPSGGVGLATLSIPLLALGGWWATDPRSFDKEDLTSPAAFLLGGFVMLFAFGWWLVLFKGAATAKNRNSARPLLWLAFILAFGWAMKEVYWKH